MPQRLVLLSRGDLYPRDAADEAKALQESVWGISRIEPLQMQIAIRKLFVPADTRDQSMIDDTAKGLERPFKVLDAGLAKRPYLPSDKFAIADLNVASFTLLLDMVQIDCRHHSHLNRWATACDARPAPARARAKG